MQGVHAFDPKATVSIDLESFVAADHFLRRVDRVLDLSFVLDLTAPRYAVQQGRPSIDPEVYFRMQLVAYFFGVTSERQLCKDVYYNLAYRWSCRLALKEDVPDHSSLTRIRDHYGTEIFESVFRRIVEQCKQKGLVKDACRVMTDATLIAADASLNSLTHNDPGEAQKEEEAQRQPLGSIDPEAQRKLSNPTHRSRTDPDATLAQKRGTPRQLKHKVHPTIDAKAVAIELMRADTRPIHQ
jgi:transposase